MTVTEIKQALGDWSLRLRADTPKSILKACAFLGHVVFIPGKLDPTQYGDNMLRLARYVGVVRTQSTTEDYTLSGAGMSYWLGDEDEKGDVFETAVDLTAVTFSTAIAALLPAGGAVTSGVLSAVAGTYTGRHQYQTPRAAITYVTDTMGAEWRVNGDATLDAGPIANLYVTVPTALLMDKKAGRDLRYVAVPGRLGMDQDVVDYTTRVVLLAEGEGETIATGSADAPPTAYRDIHGNAVKLVRVASESSTVSGNADARAQLLLNRFLNPRASVSLSTLTYDVKGDFVVGDYIWVYDPDKGFFDPGQEIIWEGVPINPVALRCIEMTWPVPAGWTVAYRSALGVWTDLSQYYAEETGETTVVVGDFNSSLSGIGSEAVGARPSPADSSIPDAPAFTDFSSGSYQSGLTNTTKSAIRVTWTLPLNLDASTITDGDHYEIRYRPNSYIGYQVLWHDMEVNRWGDITTRRWGAPASEAVSLTPDWLTAYFNWDTNVGTIVELTPGVEYEMQIRAVDSANPPHVGPWSASSFPITVGDIFAPSTPAPPTVAASMIAIQVTHTLGVASGGEYNLEPDLDHLEVHIGGASDFAANDGSMAGKLTANAALLEGHIPATGSFKVDSVPGVWVKVVAVDRAGNRSSASAGAQATALLIDDQHITSLTVSKLTAGTITANTILAAALEIGSGGNVTLTEGRLNVKDGSGRVIMEIGKRSDGFYGMLVSNPAGAPQVLAGELTDGDYGLASVNSVGDLVKLSALAFGMTAATVPFTDSTASTSFTDMQTNGPAVTVVIGESGRCLVIMSATLNPTVNDGARMSFAISGATTMAAGATQQNLPLSMLAGEAVSQVGVTCSRVNALDGLTPGVNTFTAKYAGTFGGTVFIGNRVLIVIPY